MNARWDALSRIGPVARPLLERIDATLVRHGAPAGHPVWDQLRRLGTTPADAVAFFVQADPAPLRASAGKLRGQADHYRSVAVPTDVQWEGSVAEVYTARAGAVRDHVEAMTSRLTATGSYVEDVADWWEESRTALAAALAEALTSTQAVTITTAAEVSSTVVTAAADLGAHLLTVASAALDAGHGLLRGGSDLGEVPFRAAVDPVRRAEATIDLRH